MRNIDVTREFTIPVTIVYSSVRACLKSCRSLGSDKARFGFEVVAERWRKGGITGLGSRF